MSFSVNPLSCSTTDLKTIDGGMVIEIQCDQCSQSYRLPDRLAGQQFSCQQCQHEMLIPDAGEDEFFGSEEIYGHDLTTTSRRTSESTHSQPQEEVLWDGSSPPIFGSKKKRRKKKPTEDIVPKQRKRKRRRISAEVRHFLWWVGGVGTCVVFFLILGLFKPVLPLLAGLCLLMIGGFAVHGHASENDAGLLFRIMPLYSLIYTLTVITEVWRSALLQLGGLILLFGSLILFLKTDDPGEFVIVEKGDCTVTVDVETRGIRWDVEDPAAYHTKLESPNMDVLRAEILKVDWQDPQLDCEVSIANSLRDGVFETLTLEKHQWNGAEDWGLRLLWERYADEIEEAGAQEVRIASARDAYPAFERFLKGDDDWSEGFNWRVSQDQ